MIAMKPLWDARSDSDFVGVVAGEPSHSKLDPALTEAWLGASHGATGYFEWHYRFGLVHYDD